VPTGAPVHYDSDARPKRLHSIKLENYAGHGVSFEAFLASKYEKHSRYYKWNDDDRVFHLKNCLTGPAVTVLRAGGKHATATQLIAFLQNRHGTENQLERFWLELYGWKCQPTESLQDLYQVIRRLISLACPNDVSETSERLAINQFTHALDNENIRFEVLNKNPTTLETARHIALRYEALKPSHSAPQGTASNEPTKGTDVSTYIYDKKGRKKDSLRAHEMHVVPDTNSDAKYEVKRAINNEGQRKIIDLQQQLEGWRNWPDEQTRAQAAYASGSYYNQGYPTPQYIGASMQAVPSQSGTQAAGYQPQNNNQKYSGKPNQGKDNSQRGKKYGTPCPCVPTQTTACFTCGDDGHWRSSCPQNRVGQPLSIMNAPAPTQDTRNIKLNVVT